MMYHPSCADRDQLPDYWSGGTSQAHPPTLDAGTLNTTAVVLPTVSIDCRRRYTPVAKSQFPTSYLAEHLSHIISPIYL